MRSTHGWREVCAGAIFLAALAAASGESRATPQVVGDEACERHEVDIASFATCRDGRVTRPEPATPDAARTVVQSALPPPSAAPRARPDGRGATRGARAAAAPASRRQ